MKNWQESPKSIEELTKNVDMALWAPDGTALCGDAREAALHRSVQGICNDSRKVKPGDLFFCITGAASDGHDYAAKVAEAGAAALVLTHVPDDLKKALLTLPEDARPVLIRTEDTRLAMAEIAAAWYDHPAEELTVIGLTGTKGKTTTTYMIREMLEHAGIPTGLIGTVETIIGEEHIPADNTTPESTVLQQDFRRMADAGLKAVVMEVSSQALMLHRTRGFLFDIAVFTNIEPDHIGPAEHKDFDDYLHCKSLLFKQCRQAVVNGDDPHTPQILEGCTCPVISYGMESSACDLAAQDLMLTNRLGQLGVAFRLTGLEDYRVEVAAPGRFSVYNALAALCVGRLMNVPREMMTDALAHIHVRGRIEPVKVSDHFTVLIDYAHNAMALRSLLTTLRAYNPGRLICLFGCGGNRARSRRFEMGEVSGRLADLTIITSDNPRYEKPADIIADIRTGIEKTNGDYVEIPDRREAIRYALEHGQQGDIIVLAGKGHEDYQEIEGVKHPMDERVMIRELIETAGIDF